MNLRDAEDLARKLMAEWLHPSWTFHWNNSTRAHGECRTFDRDGCGLYRIYLSRRFTAINPREVVEDTIRHEIAHALTTGSYGHSDEWKANAVRVGARPEECAGPESVNVPHKWLASCGNCGKKYGAFRRTRDMADGDRACTPCCHTHSGGEWDQRFALTFIKQW